MTDLTLFPEDIHILSKIPLVERGKKQSSILVMPQPIPNELNPKRFLAPLLNG